jgi:hypothetical protein
MLELTAIGVLVLIALVDKALHRNLDIPPAGRREPRDIVKKKLELDQLLATHRIDVAAYIHGLAALGLNRPATVKKIELVRTRETDVTTLDVVSLNIQDRIRGVRSNGPHEVMPRSRPTSS